MSLINSTTGLNEILVAINELPEAGGGTETAPITLMCNGVEQWTREYEVGSMPIIDFGDGLDVVGTFVTFKDSDSPYGLYNGSGNLANRVLLKENGAGWENYVSTNIEKISFIVPKGGMIIDFTLD